VKVVLVLITFLVNILFQPFAQTDDYATFTTKVENEFQGKEQKKNSIGILPNGDEFDFAGTLISNYENFAQNRYKSNDFIDAYYFRTKAMKIQNYRIISPANPYSFGILPDDIEQFTIAREQLRNVSINAIINSNDGLVLADSYIAFDCWLEAFEEGNSQDRVDKCKNRFLDNMKAMRVSLLTQGYNVFDMTSKENLALNDRYSTCESCVLYSKGLYCNSLYFEPDEVKMLNKMNIVVKRIQRKLQYFNSATITILYYKNAYGFNNKLSNKRLDAVKHLVYNDIAKELPVKPNIKLTPIKLDKTRTKKKIYRDAITICVSGNE
jgi:hypothetical protein